MTGNGIVLAEFPEWKDWWPSCLREIFLAHPNVLRAEVYDDWSKIGRERRMRLAPRDIREFISVAVNWPVILSISLKRLWDGLEVAYHRCPPNLLPPLPFLINMIL